MLIPLGYVVVLLSVFGGYVLAGGSLGPLYQPTELLMIGGAGVGAFIAANNGKAIKATVKILPKLKRTKKYTTWLPHNHELHMLTPVQNHCEPLIWTLVQRGVSS